MQLQYTRSRVSCHCENLLFMPVYLLEWAGYHSSMRFVTPLKVKGEGRSGDNTHLLLFMIMQSHSFMTSTSLRE